MMAIVGAEPIGVEMAQTFARLGTKVTLIINHRQINKPVSDSGRGDPTGWRRLLSDQTQLHGK